MFNVIGAMAQFERDLIKERVKNGMANAKWKGIRLGRKPLEIDVDVIRQFHADGLSFEDIAQRTGLSLSTAFRKLRSAAA